MQTLLKTHARFIHSDSYKMGDPVELIFPEFDFLTFCYFHPLNN